MKKSRLAIFLSVLLTAVLCIYAAQTRVPPKIKGVTITFRIYKLNADGTTEELGKQIAYISASGSWRTVKMNTNGNVVQVLVADASRGGVFSIEHSEALRLADFTPRGIARLDAEGYRRHRQVVAEETLLGYRAFVQRITTPSGEVIAEATIIPEFDVLPIKQVRYENNGSREIIEPVEINLGEPANILFHIPANMAVRNAPVPNVPPNNQ